MAYAEAVTATPPAVTDEMVAGLRRAAGRRAAGRAHHDGGRGERPVAVQQLARADQPGLQGPLRDPGALGRDRPTLAAVRPAPAAAVLAWPTRCSAASPTPRTSSRTPGCAGRRPTGTTSPTTRAYLVQITTRLALDRLGSARARRESYVGPWLPEPLLTGGAPVASAPAGAGAGRGRRARRAGVAGPARRARDAVPGRAGGLRAPRGLRHVGRRRSPAPSAAREAAVRQMAHRAREHVQARQPRFDADRRAQREVTERFLAAVAGGDVEALLAALAPGRRPDQRRRGQGEGGAAADHRRGQGRPLPRGRRRRRAGDIPGLRIEVAEVNGSPGDRRLGGRRAVRVDLPRAWPDGRIEQVLVVVQPGQAAPASSCGSGAAVF